MAARAFGAKASLVLVQVTSKTLGLESEPAFRGGLPPNQCHDGVFLILRRVT